MLTEELVDVGAENVGVRQHDVVRRVVFRSSVHDGLVLVKSLTQLTNDTSSLLELAGVLLLHRSDVVRLLNQRVF